MIRPNCTGTTCTIMSCWQSGRTVARCKTGGKSELRRAVCRITSGRAPALLRAGSFDGKCHRKHTARSARPR